MSEFLRALANVLGLTVTDLGLIDIFFKAVDSVSALIILAILLFLWFVSLVIYQINKLEIKVDILEEKYKRADELVEIRSEILNLKRYIKWIAGSNLILKRYWK